MAKDKHPIPETEEERYSAILSLAEKQATERLPGRGPEDMELTNLIQDLKEQISLSYPESREMRGR